MKPPPDGRGREWFGVAGAVVDRRGSDAQSIDDGPALTLEGGYDLVTTRYLRAGFELGVNWSHHDMERISGIDDDPDIDVARWNLGGRASLSIEPLGVVAYVDGGIYFRSEDSDEEPDQEQDGRGSYVGGGLDFWYDSIGRMGPFVRYYDFADSDLTEVLVGLSITFYP
jgi:hypothetical protein